MNTALIVLAAALAYGAVAWVASRLFGIIAHAGTAHLDRPLPDDWAGAHPFMPGGSPAGEGDRS